MLSWLFILTFLIYLYTTMSHDPFRDPAPSDPYAQSDPFSDPVKGSNAFSHSNNSFDNIDTGAPTLSARERELEARERAVRAAEVDIERQRTALGAQANNWPPFYPLIHHDISDLPEQHRTVGKLLYFQWLALALTLILNMVGCVLLLVGGAAEGGADMGASVMYIPVIGIASFFAWYRPIYLGLSRTEGRAMAFWFCKSRVAKLIRYLLFIRRLPLAVLCIHGRGHSL